jgi:hypothetical protein
MNEQIIKKIALAFEKDPEILCDRADLETTLGTDAKYLKEVLGITKSDLIRLERKGLAIKARYSTRNTRKRKHNIYSKTGDLLSTHDVTGPHRVRWIIFKEVLNEQNV